MLCALQLPEYAAEDGAVSADRIPALLLRQLRWLDFVEDCPALVRQLMDVMEVCAEPIQREIISLLPELVDDELHEVPPWGT